MKASLDLLEDNEQARVKLQSDAIRKLIVCEVSMFKNIEYDLINISKVIGFSLSCLANGKSGATQGYVNLR